MKSSLTRFNFLTASAYARCPSTTIRGRQRLRWRNVMLWWYHARLLWGHHWFSPCWILPTWRIRFGHAPKSPARELSSFSSSAKQTSKAYKWPLLTTGTPSKLLNTKQSNSSSSFSFSSAICTGETKQRHQNTHTRGVSVHSELWISSASCTVHSKRGIYTLRNGTEIRGICCCCCWTAVCRNSKTQISTNLCFAHDSFVIVDFA